MSKLKGSHEKDRSEPDEKSPNLEIPQIPVDFDSDTILLGYQRYVKLTERLHRHHREVKISDRKSTTSELQSR